jgi:hypothetical protein
MHHHYACIRRRIVEPPKWWDEDGVPRYDEFSPRETANIYAKECVLLRIECQDCEREFDVCMSWTETDRLLYKRPSLLERVRDKTIHYGDPPNVECCPAGPTMNSNPRRVLQFWRQEIGAGHMEWERRRDFEIDVSEEPDDADA